MIRDISPQQNNDSIKHILKEIPSLLEKTFPVPQRFRSKLPHDIADLSRLLTNQRGQRSLSYLTRPNYLSAYLHYFLPWNICRLCLLLPDFNLRLDAGGVITDLGSGPLTFACALWISRPDLRNVPIEINCIDRSASALEAGKKFFKALCGENLKWKINLIKKEIDFRKSNSVSISGNNKTGKKPSLVCAVNIFNEIYEKIPRSNIDALRLTAANAAVLLSNAVSDDPDAAIFIVEPGVPQSGKFISILRDELIKSGREPVSPCTHTASCPCLSHEKWCHFAYNAENAPKELLRLSAAAKLPKARLVLSYLLTGPKGACHLQSEQRLHMKAKKGDFHTLRVISDAFPLGADYGRYGCCEKGLVLLKGRKNIIEKTVSGSLVDVNINLKERDEKSGAYIGEIK